MKQILWIPFLFTISTSISCEFSNFLTEDEFNILPVNEGYVFKGVIWFDMNHDGLRDEGEDRIEGVHVNLRDIDQEIIGTTNSDSNGNYRITTTIISRGYYIEVKAPDGFTFTLQNVGPSSAGSDVDSRGFTPLLTETYHATPTDLRFEDLDPHHYGDAGLITETFTPTPEPTEALTDIPTLETFMPFDDTHQFIAIFFNGTGGCAQPSEFSTTLVVTIDGNRITMLLVEEGFTYSGTINSDGTFLVTDDEGFDEAYEGKFNADWSGEAVNTLTVDGCTTTWDVKLTPSE